MRRALIATAVVAVATAGGFAARAALAPRSSEPTAQEGERQTATVEKRDLIDRAELDGTLGYADDRPLAGGLQGTLTAIAAEGSTIERGEMLYAVDGRPVRLLYGSVPAWRTLQQGVSEGADVRQLEQNLKAMGYSPGTVDTTFAWQTAAALKKWQKATGSDQTGILERGTYVFLPGARRMGAHNAMLGDQAGGNIATTTSTTRIVTVELSARRQQLVRKGVKVIIDLPTGRSVDGTITDVGQVAKEPENPQSDPTITVTITLERKADVRGLDEAPVNVRVATDVAKDALAVPVSALLARAEGGYALEVLDGSATRLVPVDTGAYADGFVQVTGDGISEGTMVVIAK